MMQYIGESKKAKISYEGMELEIGYTAMHTLVGLLSSSHSPTYFSDIQEVCKFLSELRNKMGADAAVELESIHE